MPIQAPLFSAAPALRGIQASSLDILWMILEALTRRGFLSAARRSSASGRPAACRRQKPTLTSDVTLYDAELHNRSRNRARNWVHSRIWPSRDYFLSTPSTRKTTIVPLLSLVCRTARPAAARTDQMTAATRPARRAQAHADGVATTRERPTATYRCTRTRRSCVPSRPSVECWQRQFWADRTSNFSKRKFHRDKHALCDFCNAAEFFPDSHSAGPIFSFDVTHLLQEARVSP